MQEYQVAVIGGGLAGLTAAIALGKAGITTLVIERHEYPRHKVCGEYLSGEVVPLLKALGVPLQDAQTIKRFNLVGLFGKEAHCNLPLEGIGISRYALDFRMMEVARQNGVEILHTKATALLPEDKGIEIVTGAGRISARIALGCWGKRSLMDRQTNREFLRKKSPWMGLKMHYEGVDFPADTVGLYTIPGGYGGCSLTETGALNYCMLLDQNQFRIYGDPDTALEASIAGNPKLKLLLQGAKPSFQKPLSIAEIAFGQKDLVQKNVLYCGDAAQLIHPLCGNGMAMAIHAGYMAAQAIADQFNKQDFDFDELSRVYQSNWHRTFNRRLRWGKTLQSLVTKPQGLRLGISTTRLLPGLLEKVIAQTQGRVIPVNRIEQISKQ
ncbi:Dehydrogenase (flavoprotein) [Robiginitalea myxolifaciens]|uniref:Dehydrogenase (Flavoprotein) n=1 Tax=Robiginitalea myxolifaciens TaxID=400055 RepID=A0A1I6GYQ9_9FLAO|nr:NAD(P)/FAD-dependent oxidoreductase [Robiginitalea myxolifaciens]SFR47335.1 Dehydrogenase (flavoprotein) [Robiginitalea myxolifaciens]